MDKITVHRKRGPAWVFKREETGYYYHTRKNTYRIFFDTGKDPDVWIGLLVERAPSDYIWITYESQIRATRVEFGRGAYVFS